MLCWLVDCRYCTGSGAGVVAAWVYNLVFESIELMYVCIGLTFVGPRVVCNIAIDY